MSDRYEIPMLRALVSAMGREGAIAACVRMHDDPETRDAVSHHVGGKIEIYDNEMGGRDVQVVFALREPTVGPDGAERDDGIFWDNGGIVIRGTELPHAVAQHAIGRPMTDILPHPLLEGLVVASFETFADGVTAMDAVDAFMSLDQVEAMQ